MPGSFLGPAYAPADIERRLRFAGAVFETLDDKHLINHCAQVLADGKALGWYQGRMEFGPRLGHAFDSRRRAITNHAEGA
jgi:carbamoyltransferase